MDLQPYQRSLKDKIPRFKWIYALPKCRERQLFPGLEVDVNTEVE